MDAEQPPGGALDWMDACPSVRRALRAWLARQSADDCDRDDRYRVLRMAVNVFADHRGSAASGPAGAPRPGAGVGAPPRFPETIQNRVSRADPARYRRAVGRRWHRFVADAAPVLGLATTAPAWATGGEPVWRVYLACRDAAVWRAVDADRDGDWERRFDRLDGLLERLLPRGGDAVRLTDLCRAVRRELFGGGDGGGPAPAPSTVGRRIARAARADPARFAVIPGPTPRAARVARRGADGPPCATA